MSVADDFAHRQTPVIMLRHDESNSPYLTPHPSSFSLSYSFSSTNPNPRFERRKEEKKCSISARECFQSQMKILENQRVLSLTLSIKSQKKSLWAVIEELATHKKKLYHHYYYYYHWFITESLHQAEFKF